MSLRSKITRRSSNVFIYTVANVCFIHSLIVTLKCPGFNMCFCVTEGCFHGRARRVRMRPPAGNSSARCPPNTATPNTQTKSRHITRWAWWIDFHVGNIVKVISQRSVYLTSIHRFTSTSLLIPKLIRLLWVTTELDSAFYAFPMKWQWALSLIAPVPPSVCASVRLKFSWMQFLLHH